MLSQAACARTFFPACVNGEKVGSEMSMPVLE
jgi:hypothetical protein